jgi:hypothetical protein
MRKLELVLAGTPPPEETRKLEVQLVQEGTGVSLRVAGNGTGSLGCMLARVEVVDNKIQLCLYNVGSFGDICHKASKSYLIRTVDFHGNEL